MHLVRYILLYRVIVRQMLKEIDTKAMLATSFLNLSADLKLRQNTQPSCIYNSPTPLMSRSA